MLNPKIKEVQANENYTLTITFDNGEKRLFDVTPFYSKGIFNKLKELTYFKRARIAFDGIEWPDQQDLSHDTLYLLSKPVHG